MKQTILSPELSQLLLQAGLADHFGPRKFFTLQDASTWAQQHNITSSLTYDKIRKTERRLHSNPPTYYSDWISWDHFLNRKPRSFPPYSEAQKLTKIAGITSEAQYNKSFKQLRLPSDPREVYKKQWIDFDHFLDVTPLLYPEFLALCQQHGIHTYTAYQRFYAEQKNPRLRTQPGHFYPEFKGWGRTTRGFTHTYSQAQRLTREAGITTCIQYHNRYKTIPGLPGNPKKIYFEWLDWPTFLGTTKKPLPLKQFKIVIQKKKVINLTIYRESYKKLDLPSDPWRIYHRPWAQLIPPRFKSLSQARRLTHKAGLLKWTDYKAKYKNIPGLPANPQTYYKMTWRKFISRSP